MRAYHWTILLWATLFPATRGTKQSIGYEFLSQYYAYKMEARVVGAGNTKLAYGCPGTGDGGICTFMEFVIHLSRSNEPKIAWEWGWIDRDAGGPKTIDPDVKVVGGDFQNYVKSSDGYTFEDINGEAFHTDFRKKARRATFKNRFDRVLRSIQAARAGSGAQPGATPIPGNDPDFKKSLDAAEWARLHRRFDESHHLAKALREIGSIDLKLKGGGKFTSNFKVETGNEDLDGRTYTYLKVADTIKASGATTPEKDEAFRDMMGGIKKGKMPDGSMPVQLEELAKHAHPLEVLLNHVAAMKTC